MNEGNETVLRQYEEQEEQWMKGERSIRRLIAEAFDAAGFSFSSIELDGEYMRSSTIMGDPPYVDRLRITIISPPYTAPDQSPWPISAHGRCK